MVVYFLLSLIASTINESIATALRWRSHFLEAWLRNVLVDPQKTHEAEAKLTEFFAHPLLAPLLKQPRWWSSKQTKLRRPSYIPSEVFGAVLFAADPKSRPADAGKVLDEAIAKHLSTQLQEVVTALRKVAGD